jgi:hypothetical protein
MPDNEPTEKEMLFLDACESLSDEEQEKVLLMVKRIAKKHPDQRLTEEQIRIMFDNDSDIPLH